MACDVLKWAATQYANQITALEKVLWNVHNVDLFMITNYELNFNKSEYVQRNE